MRQPGSRDRDSRSFVRLPGARVGDVDRRCRRPADHRVRDRVAALIHRMIDADLEDLLRPLAPRVLGALVRRYGHFDLAEDATQEALLAAALQWRTEGVPDNPRAWLVTVGSRRITDLLRSEQARQRRETELARRALRETLQAPAADNPQSESDDTLILLFMCCHPSLAPASQIALTLRAVGGLTTAEVARAFLVSEDTMARRISRAKQQIKERGVAFRMPAAAERSQGLSAVLQVLYLIFNEGYASTSGPLLHRVELSAEAIRLTRLLHSLLPDDHEVAGLLALMLLTDARRPARAAPDGSLVPMADQDPAAMEQGLHRGRGFPGHRRQSRRTTRPLSAASGDRSSARCSAGCRVNGLATDREPVRAALADGGQPGRCVEPRRGGGHGGRRSSRAEPPR